MFFDNQEQIMLKYRFELNNLWNEAEGGGGHHILYSLQIAHVNSIPWTGQNMDLLKSMSTLPVMPGCCQMLF